VRIKEFSLLVFVGMFIFNSSFAQKAKWVDGIIAVVGDKIVLRSELETELANVQLDTISDPEAFACETLRGILLTEATYKSSGTGFTPIRRGKSRQ